MLSAKKRGNVWRIEGMVDRRYVRLSLGTRDADNAARLKIKLQDALLLGKECKLWPDPKKFLPPATFAFFAAVVDWKEETESPAPTWTDLIRDFSARFRRQILQGERSEATWKRYQLTCDSFSGFLKLRRISRLEDITRRVSEDFKGWKLEQTLARKHSRNGQGLRLDVAILHGVFAFAIEMDLLVRNPMKSEGTPGKKTDAGAQPFTHEELTRLRHFAGEDLLAFLVLRHTGLRGFDATDLRWADLDLKDRMLSRLTHKRGKQVWIPLHPELLFALEAGFVRRQPKPDDHVLLNPETKKPMSRPRLYERMLALGRRGSYPGASASLPRHPRRRHAPQRCDRVRRGQDFRRYRTGGRGALRAIREGAARTHAADHGEPGRN
jgi:integrase